MENSQEEIEDYIIDLFTQLQNQFSQVEEMLVLLPNYQTNLKQMVNNQSNIYY